MQTNRTIPFRCPACGFQSQVTVTSIVDPSVNPQAKQTLLAGQLNAAQCPNCGTVSAVPTPLLYHDASKELLITFMPMQLGMSEADGEKTIGALLRTLTSAMDSKLMKGYIFQPRRALTMQGVIEQVLEADGVTREMMDEQKERSRLIQLFLQAEPAQLEGLVKEHDAKLDMVFFQTMSIVAQRYAQEGRMDAAEHVLNVQQQLAQLSTVGQQLMARAQQQDDVINEVAEALQRLGERTTASDVIQLLRGWANDEDRLQAAVGLARPIFDQHFFDTLTQTIGSAPADERDSLATLRDTLLELVQTIDQQQQMQLQAAANVLRQILTAPDPAQAVRENLALIDETVIAVLDLNIQQAQRQGEIEASARLKAVRDMIMGVLQENMQPEVRFINELLSAESQSAAEKMVEERAPDFGEGLLDVFDALAEVVAAQGQAQLVQRLQTLRAKAEEVLS